MPERETLGTPKAGTQFRMGPIPGRGGWLRTVLLSVCVLAVLSSSSYAYENRPLAAEGAAYEEEIKARIRDDRDKLSPEDLEMLKTLVGPILPRPPAGKGPRRKGASDAVFAYELLIARGKGTSATWLKLARAHSDPGPHRNLRKAARAAYMAYKAAGSGLSRAMALGFLATVFDKTRDSSQALMAIREASRLVPREDAAGAGTVIGRLARSLDQTRNRLEKRHSFRLRRFRVYSNRPKPSVCLTFSGPLAGRGRVRYRDYIQINPAAQVALNPEGKSLCLEGLAHGRSYKITVLKGMPDRHGLKTPAGATVRAAVPDRAPQVAFRNSAYVLPARKAKDLPLSVVNVRTVKLRVYHVVERNLIREIMAGNITRQLYNWKLREFRENTGELLWRGSLDVETQVNRETRTSIPLGEILKDGRPGVYVVAARAGGVLATQWVVMSDLGLSTVKGRDGLHVFVRSLKSAKPVAGAEVRLIARNNKVLDTVTSDGRGVARFPAGRVRGRGGNAPAAVMARTPAAEPGEGAKRDGPSGDFNFLDLTRPAMDLSDRGVAGRPFPGPMDVYLYTDRGVYRPGERVNLMALLRDDRGRGLPDLPLTLKVFRPDGLRFGRFVRRGDAGGGSRKTLRLPVTARTGTWRVSAHIDEKAGAIGQAEFQVEDFVPARIELALSPSAGVLRPFKALSIQAKGTYLYGASASGLKADAEVVLVEDKDPHPAFADYRFGKVGEAWAPKRMSFKAPPTDESGMTRVTIRVKNPGETTKPLKAVIRVNLFEKGGRPARKSLTIPLRYRPFEIGIRPEFKEDAVEEGREARFSVIAVDPEGKAVAAKGLRYAFFEENWDYVWYTRGGRWTYRRVIRDRLIARGDVVFGATGPAALSRRAPFGRYRLEVDDPQTGAGASVRFRAGWFVSPSPGDKPDKLELTLDKKSYAPGETARVYVKPPFDAEALVLVVNDRLHETRSLRVPAAGMAIPIHVSEEWGAGAYIMAAAYRPENAARRRGPGRAVGLAWAAVRPPKRTLKLAIEAPDEALPRRTATVSVKVEGYTGKGPVFITLAAVDEGILSLTDFKSPDPRPHYFGKRKLGVDLHDIYGRLIDADADSRGRIRTGGGEPAGGARNLVAPSARTVRSVALFSGRVRVNEAGVATVPLALPDFNGRLRLMAVGYGRDSVGAAETFMVVREPLVTQISMPRFLAPGDEGDIHLTLHNLASPAGRYEVRLDASGAVGTEGGPARETTLSRGERRSLTFRLKGREGGGGVGRVWLSVRGPGDYALDRDWEIPVRPGRPVLTETLTRSLDGGKKVRFGRKVMAKFSPNSGRLLLSLSAIPNVNATGLLRDLDRYPYGCLEQVTSRALPLLYLGGVARSYGIELKGKDGLTRRVQSAIERVLDRQLPNGGFAPWSPYGRAEEWLTPFVMDFLVRARAQKHFVPEFGYRLGLDWLKASVAGGRYGRHALAARAYALYVLAKAGEARIGDLRYFYETYFDKLPTILARAQIAGALARYGERKLAIRAFQTTLADAARGDAGRIEPRGASATRVFYDYGSALRDVGGFAHLLAESDLMPGRAFELAERVAERLSSRRYTSTQEKAWLLLAAHAFAKNRRPMRLSLEGGPAAPHTKPVRLALGRSDLETDFTVRNEGEHPVYLSASLSGAPKEDPPPMESGFRIQRRYFTLDGKEIGLEKVGQGEVLAVLITGRATTGLSHRALIVDLLPAGFEIENAGLAHTASVVDLSWMGFLTRTEHTGLRDDRYVAAVNLTKNQKTFRLAYIVRAVTPGRYYAPAVFVEDMYKPRFRALGASGRLVVTGR